MTVSLRGGHRDTRGAISAKIAIHNDVEPDDWQMLYERLQKRSNRLERILFHGFVLLSTLVGLFAAAGALACVILSACPEISSVYLACFILPPGCLLGAAMGQRGGNRFLRLWYGLDEATRRGFAARLTLARAQAQWPRSTKRWLFTGDWLTVPEYDHRLPYVRIFVSGSQPKTCKDEDALWREILGNVSGDGNWEAGANHREISYPSQLPGWARKIDAADGAGELERRIGENTARDWIGHLWRRAARQWPLLGSAEFPLHSGRRIFETHYLPLSGEREALVVVLRPAGFASETEADRGEAARSDSIAA
ncbi:MAG: hypothetical protein LBT97_04285 [Planctomycetota bacterium]|jgi:hypothetical protein|nr:hypothetical protein [Planctomycetota bacterium]